MTYQDHLSKSCIGLKLSLTYEIEGQKSHFFASARKKVYPPIWAITLAITHFFN